MLDLSLEYRREQTRRQRLINTHCQIQNFSSNQILLLLIEFYTTQEKRSFLCDRIDRRLSQLNTKKSPKDK